MQDLSMAQSSPTPSPDAKPQPKWKGFASSILINGLLPYGIYTLLHRMQVPEFYAMVGAGVPSLLDALIGLARRKRMDFLAGFTLFNITLSLFLLSLGANPRLYLIRESIVTGAYGAAMLASLALAKPIGFYTGRYFMTANDPVKSAGFDWAWENRPAFRRMVRVITFGWGIGLIGEAALRWYLVSILPVAVFLIIAPWVYYGCTATLVAWSAWFGKSSKARADRLRHEEENPFHEPAQTPALPANPVGDGLAHLE